MGTLKLIIGITGASGSVYAHLMLKRLAGLKDQIADVAVVISKTAEQVWKHELPDIPLDTFGFRKYPPDTFFAPIASGSSGYHSMIIIPCSVGTLGRIASGTADDLMARAADVMLKERRKLILTVRETPLNLIHIRNMERVTEAGGIILPASPSFYMEHQSVEDLCLTVVDRALSLAGIDTGKPGFMS
jgi:4-hydroxy-3-polyprenylbenzoate decarboxylase